MIINWNYISFDITTNKRFELEWYGNYKHFLPLFVCDLKWTTKQDRAGLSFIFGIRRLFWFDVGIRDRRNWYIEEGRYFNSRKEEDDYFEVDLEDK